MTRGEGDEITDIVITPKSFRCNHCRLVVSSRLDWKDHMPACRRQQAKMRRLGLIAERPGINRANIFNRVVGGTAIEVLVTPRAAGAGRRHMQHSSWTS